MSNYEQADSDKRMKPRMSLLPQEALIECAEIMTAACEKWGEDSWRKRDVGLFIDAAMRHTNKYLRGEEIDQESNKPHLYHAAVNLLIAGELTSHKAR